MTSTSTSDPADAAVGALLETAPPGTYDDDRPLPEATPDDDEGELAGEGAIGVLRRGLAVTPELKEGVWLTVVLAFVTSAGKLAVNLPTSSLSWNGSAAAAPSISQAAPMQAAARTPGKPPVGSLDMVSAPSDAAAGHLSQRRPTVVAPTASGVHRLRPHRICFPEPGGRDVRS